MSDSQVFCGLDLIGGGLGAIDKINGNRLSDKDMFLTIKNGILYPHWLDADSGASEDSPNVISPDLNAGNKRHLLAGIQVADIITKGPQIDIRAHLPSGFVTNGSVDYATEMQEAFSEAANGKIIVPQGTWLTSLAITLPRFIVIEGHGTGNPDVQGSIILLSDSAADGTNVFERKNVALTGDQIVIRDLQIRGNWDAVTASGSGNGLHLEYVYEVILDNVLIGYCKNDGIYLSRPAYHVYRDISIRENRKWGMEIEDHDGTDGSTTVQIIGRSIFNGNDRAATQGGGAIKATNINQLFITAIAESNNIFFSLNGTSNNVITLKHCYTENQQSADTLIDLSGATGVQKIEMSNNYFGGKAATIQYIKSPTGLTHGDTILFLQNYLSLVDLETPADFTLAPDKENYDSSGFFDTGATASSTTIATFTIPSTAKGCGIFQIGIAGDDKSNNARASTQLLNLHIFFGAAIKAELETEDADSLLGSATVDMQHGDSKTTVYTVPAGKSAVITKVIIHSPSGSLDSGSTGDFDIGSGANADTWKQSIDLDSMTAATDYMVITSENTKYTLEAAAAAFGIKPITGASADRTATMEVYGHVGSITNGDFLGWSKPVISVAGQVVSLKITPGDASGTKGRIWWRGCSYFRVDASNIVHPVTITVADNS